MTERQVDVSAGEGVELPLPAGRVEALVRHVLEAEGADVAEVSVAFLDDAQITALNRQYLSRDRPTDVISFPLRSPDETLLGDVYIGVEQARRQAEDWGVPLAEELLRLTVHGTLHVLGYDHPDEAEQRAESVMFRRQEELLRQFLDVGPSAPPGS